MTPYPTAGRDRLAEFLDGLPILSRWLPGHPVVWQTGQQDGPDTPPPASHHTHCSAFAAAVALYLDLYLLRPPHHGQIALANAQAKWLSGTGTDGGPTAAASGWSSLGTSGDAKALTAAQAAANAGMLVLACYASPPSASGAAVPGHIAIVRPQHQDATGQPAGGPLVIMAGTTNYRSVSMQTAFAEHPGAWPGNIALFAHATPLEHDVTG